MKKKKIKLIACCDVPLELVVAGWSLSQEGERPKKHQLDEQYVPGMCVVSMARTLSQSHYVPRKRCCCCVVVYQVPGTLVTK